MGRRRVLDLAGWVPITSPELILKFERFLWKGRGAGLAFWVFIALVVSRFAVWALLLALAESFRLTSFLPLAYRRCSAYVL